MIDGGEVYMWIMDLREQPLWNAGEVVSEDQATCLDRNFVDLSRRSSLIYLLTLL